MKINIEIDDAVIRVAGAANKTPEQWVQEVIGDKLQTQTVPAESEAKRLELLAKLFKTYKSANMELSFTDEDEVILRDLEARGFVGLSVEGFQSTFGRNTYFLSGITGSPITPKGVEYLEKTKIDKFIGHPVYKLLKEIRQWL